MIYFVESPDGLRVKIGTTIRLSQRIKQLVSQYGGGLKVVAVTDGSFVEEAELHARFAAYRVEGEWFFYDKPIREFIRDHADPWDGTDEVPDEQASAKIDRGVMMKAKIVASAKKMTLAEYLTETLQAHVERDWTKVIRKIEGKEAKGE